MKEREKERARERKRKTSRCLPDRHMAKTHLS